MPSIVRIAAPVARHEEDRRNRGRFRRTAALSAGLAALTIPAAAFAQAENVPYGADAIADEDAAGGEAIVVTASRRRDEAVQDVPIALTVISGAHYFIVARWRLFSGTAGKKASPDAVSEP